MVLLGAKPPKPICPYFTRAEDHWKTTIFPKCSCKGQYCDKYQDHYCPIKEDEDKIDIFRR